MMRSQGIHFILLNAIFPLFFMLLRPASLKAQESTLQNQRTLNIYFENDMFYGTDRCYTGGLKFSWISQASPSENLAGWIRWLPMTQRAGYLSRFSLSLGQNLYTPDNILIESIISDDRPYAGMIYLTLGVHSRKTRIHDSLELTLGMLGPVALGEQVQKFVHDLVGGEDPRGWHNQLKNEPVLGLSFQRKWKLWRAGASSGFGFELIPHIGGGAGNLYVYANSGAQVRLGWRLPEDFGINLSRPGGDRGVNPRYRGRFGFLIFAAVDGKFVLRNILLDGNTFADSNRVDKEPLTADLIVGAGFRAGRFNFSYEIVYWTKKFKTESRDQVFGTFNLSYSY